jgi:protease-4
VAKRKLNKEYVANTVRRPRARRQRLPLLAGWALLAGLLAGCGPTSFLITPVRAVQDLEEHVLIRESVWAGKKIALIEVDGVLRNARDERLLGPAGENPVSLFREKLDKAAHDSLVKAVVVRINSPGGTVTASDLMYAELRRFRAEAKKPVIASMLDLGASGGYYLACAADRIYAHPTTVTGSIGVIMIAPEISGTMKKLGIRTNVFKSAELKDAGSPFREMTERDREVFQSIIDQMYARFLEVVAESRTGIDAERLRTLADGRVFLAPEAKEHGLVDEIGTLADALAAAKQVAGIAEEKVLVVQYARPLSHRANVYADAPAPPAQVNVVNVQLPDWLSSPSPQFLYLWAPGW